MSLSRLLRLAICNWCGSTDRWDEPSNNRMGFYVGGCQDEYHRCLAEEISVAISDNGRNVGNC